MAEDDCREDNRNVQEFNLGQLLNQLDERNKQLIRTFEKIKIKILNEKFSLIFKKQLDSIILDDDTT